MTIHLDKVNGFGGGAGGGGVSSSFPTIVTDSGSSLPSASGYQEGDTFLNTGDKKIYQAEEIITGYTLATGVSNSNTGYADVVVDLTTGIASGFKGERNKYNWFGNFNIDKRWIENKEYKVHFKFLNNISSWQSIFSIINNTAYVQYGTQATIIDVGIKNNKLHIQAYSVSSSMGSGSYTTIISPLEILDYTLETNTEYFLTINKKENGLIETSISSTSYTENILKVQTTETGIEDVNTYDENCSIYYGKYYPYSSSYSGTYYNTYGTSFVYGEVYLGDSMGDFVIPTTALSWDSGTSLTDKTEYADKTNGILYLYENEVLNAIPNLEDYKKKAETITISTASVTIANVQANKNYVLSSSALTNITLTACETSFEETSINFTTGSSAPTFTDNASIKWFGGVPEMKANTTYTIVIFNKQAYWQEQENV